MLSKKFDLMISLGEMCGCALYLRKFKLRDHSYPFDWLCKAPFEKRIELIVNDFEGFFLKENLKKIDADGGALYHDSYEDINTGFVFLHDFPEDSSLDSLYDEVYEKYQRRISRLYEKVAEMNQVLFIWFSLSAVLSETVIVEAQRKLSQKFNKDIHLLIFENDNTIAKLQEDTVNDFVLKIKGPFKDDSDSVMGDEKLGDAIFSRINGNKKYSYVIFKGLMRVACCFIPSKRLRRKIREEYENKW